MAQRVNLVEHAVLADRLTVMRDRTTPHGVFRQAVYEASAIMAVEVARALPVREVEIETPLETTRGLRLREEPDLDRSSTPIPVLASDVFAAAGGLSSLPGDPAWGKLCSDAGAIQPSTIPSPP